MTMEPHGIAINMEDLGRRRVENALSGQISDVCTLSKFGFIEISGSGQKWLLA